MTFFRTLAQNAAWNLVGMFVATALGFVIAPLLVHRLGDTTYGLWILIGSLTGYFGLFDLGIRSSVARYIAYDRARRDDGGVNATLNTALVILAAIGMLTLLGTVSISLLYFHLFDVPAEQVASVRICLLLTGITLALSFILNAFDATLWAIQRFDVVNAIDIPLSLLRAALTFYLVHDSGDLVALAVLTLVTALAGGLAKAVLCFRLIPALRVTPVLARLGAGRALVSYGAWRLVLEIGFLLSSHMSLVIIGACLSVALVTPFSIAARVVGYATAILTACTGILVPVCAGLDADEDHQRQRRLLTEGGAICTAFALYFLGIFVFLGRPMISLWMGPELADSARWLAILGLGQVPRMTQWVTHAVILALGRHRLIACVSLGEGLVASGLAFWLAPTYGLAGVCVAFSVCNVISCGIVQMIYGCYIVGEPLPRYVRQALLRPLFAAALPILGLSFLTYWQEPSGWVLFPLVTAAYTLCFAATVLPALVGWDVLRTFVFDPMHRYTRLTSVFGKNAHSRGPAQQLP